MARAIGITNSEIVMGFYLVGFVCLVAAIKMVITLFMEVQLTDFIIIIFLLIISIVFTMMAAMWLPYLISKYNLNVFVDRISNPDWIGWLRFTKSKSFRPHIVKKGPLGQTKGMANGVKADVINRGDYTVTLPNGNQVILVMDMLPHNADLEQAKGWQLVKQHYGILGFRAWEKAADMKETIFQDTKNKEKDEPDGEIRLTD